MRQAGLHRLRRIIRELVESLPEERKSSPRIKELAGWGCITTMHLVEINAQPFEGETNARDYDFSRAANQSRWQAGYADACRTLERRPWDDPIDPATQVTVYQSDAPETQ
jgi:NTE family protein